MSEQDTSQQGTTTVESTETTTTVETTTAAAAPESGTTPAPTAAADAAELAKVRDLVIKANPDVVPELVRGDSVDALMASVEPARTAYQRVADAVRGAPATRETSEPATPTNSQPPTVPAGGAPNVVEPSQLTPETKIARALAERRRK